jgi:aminoglycoside/choline kinase family phosphotransferase
MDAPRMPDGPPVRNGLPYSRIAHLAEDVRPFVAVGRALSDAGLAVPRIDAHDLEAGLLLLEDLGDLTFGRALALGHDQRRLWLAAIDTLITLRRHPPRGMSLPDGTEYRLPRFDRAALEIEIELILDWYWPAAKGAPVPDDVRREFQALWRPVLDRMLAAPPGIFLRDFHSPNLFWLPDREGARQVGVIDFQDSLAEPWAYDVASLLQDARVDVPAGLERDGLERYMAAVAAFDPAFDRTAFLSAYASFGAQRNTRLVGLWVRLAKRDGKPHYMQHMPRTRDYLARNLDHPDLAALRVWYEQHLPEIVKKPGQAR